MKEGNYKYWGEKLKFISEGFTARILIFFIPVILAGGCLSPESIEILSPPANFDASSYIDTQKALQDPQNHFIPPEISETPRIIITDEARRNKINGKILLALYIDETGSINYISIQDSVGYGQDKVTVRALQNIPFNPATLNGKPVKAKVLFPIFINVESNRPMMR